MTKAVLDEIANPAGSQQAEPDGTGDERRRSFEREALVHIDLLYNSAVQMTRNPADAQDLVQDTFVKAYRFFDRFKAGTNCRAWLFKIMKNTFINAFRKRSRRPTQVDFENVEPMLEARPAEETTQVQESGSTDAYDELVDDDVKHALDQLPFEFRMATVLCDIEGLSYQEIAEIMECPIGTVRSRLSRSRRFLQRKLRSYARERGIGT
jgi:RNA polymerase sigma-70 factor (ECF subfamily)